MIPDQDRLDHLDPAARATGAIARRPHLAVYALVLLATIVSWALLCAIAVRDAAGRLTDGPGGTLIEALPELPLPAILERFAALCLSPDTDGAALYGFAAIAVMWMLMSVAMMLPSAAPLIRIYCELVDTALAKGEPAVHPLVLLAGYLSVWLAASLAFAAATIAAQAGAGLQPLEPLAGAAGRRNLAVHRVQGSLPQKMPEPVRDPVRALDGCAGRHIPARCRAGRCLPRLLLGADAGDVRGRYDERLLDGADCVVHAGRETGAGRAHDPDCRRHAACLGRGAASNLSRTRIEDDGWPITAGR
jgi:hypothetical protein